MDIREWTIEYVKHKNLRENNLKGFREEEGVIHFVFQDRKEDYYLREELSEDVLDLETERKTVVVCLNTSDNLDFLVENWEEFSDRKNFYFVFCHPGANQFWAVNPNKHSKIADEENLESGLNSMSESVRTVKLSKES